MEIKKDDNTSQKISKSHVKVKEIGEFSFHQTNQIQVDKHWQISLQVEIILYNQVHLVDMLLLFLGANTH